MSNNEVMASIDEEVKTRFMDDRHRMIVNVVFTAGWVQRIAATRLKPFGISSQQFNILRILRGAGDWVAMSQVKSLMVDRTPHTTRLADKLLDKGLIERQRSDEDRRKVFVNITEKGMELLSEIDKSDEENAWVFMEKITQEEARTISDILDRLRS